MIAAGIPFVMSTYGIYRGFLLMEPGMVPPGAELYAAWLDGMEHFGRPITLAEIAARGRFDLLVTGASAVSIDGVRFGKGHGFFDLEWGMFTDLGLADETTPVVAVVHDCQVVEEALTPSETDILVDFIATPDAAARGRSPRQASARREVAAARSRTDRLDPAAPGTAAPARPRLTPRTERTAPVSLKINRRAFLAATATLPLLPGLARAAGAPLIMQASWINDAEFSGYFVAIDQGYFTAEGLDLTYLSGGPDVIPESSIIAGRADLTLTTPDTTIKAIAEQGAPFKIIGTQYQKNPIGIVSLAKAPIKSPADMVGKTIAVPPVNTISVEAMLAINGIDKAIGQHRALRLRPDAADQGRDRRLARLHHQRALHHQDDGRGGGVVPALRPRLHHLQRHGGGHRGDAEDQAQGAGRLAARRRARAGRRTSSIPPPGRRSGRTPGSRAPAARSRTRSTSTPRRSR